MIHRISLFCLCFISLISSHHSQVFAASPIIMPVGDSITLGHYSGGPESDLMVGYRQQLWLSLKNAGYDFSFVGSQESGQNAVPDFDADHEGHGGWDAGSPTIDSVDDHIAGWLGTNPADILLLHIGSNDLGRDEGVASTVQDIENILDSIDSVDQNIIVLLAKIIDWENTNPDVSQLNDQLETMVAARIANGDKILIVDQQSALSYPDDMSDTLHPLPAGYIKMANTWFATLDELLHIATPNIEGPGSISPNENQTVIDGDSLDFTVTPNNGNYITSINGCNGSLSGNVYSTENITADCTISVTFADHYTITASAGTGGSINPAGAVDVDYGLNRGFIINPNTGYSLNDVLVDGSSVGPVSNYSFASVDWNHTISADFTINQYLVTPSAENHGTVTPQIPQSVNYGTTTNFTFTPDTGYHIDTVEGCGGQKIGNLYTTGAVSAPCTVTASFAINQYTVTTTQLEHGSIFPDSRNIEHGETTEFTINPINGFHIASVTGCNGTLLDNVYTTTAITADCSITAAFDSNQKKYAVTPAPKNYGDISPSLPQSIQYGAVTSFKLTPDNGYHVASVFGCNGGLSGDIYTTGPITADCTIWSTFVDDEHNEILIPVFLLLLNSE